MHSFLIVCVGVAIKIVCFKIEFESPVPSAVLITLEDTGLESLALERAHCSSDDDQNNDDESACDFKTF